MKKLTTVFLAAALVFAVASQASATPLETSGEFRARYWMLSNYFESGKNSEFWDSRLRLNLVWPVAEGVKVSVRADVMEGFWGDQLVTSTTVPPTATTPETTVYGVQSNPRPPISFDQVNLQFVWPGSPVTITVGRQGTTWGPGLMIAADNRDRFKVGAKVGPVNYFYTYDKYIESVNLHDTNGIDDKFQHSLGAVATLGGWNTGLVYAFIGNGSNPNADWSLHVIDAYAMGKGGPVDIKAEISVGFGKNDLKVGQDQDLSTIAAYGGAFMPAGPVTLGFEGVYVSGDDPSTKDKNEGALNSDYQSPFWSVVLFNNLDYNGYMGESNTATDAGVSNAWACKFSGALGPAPGLSLYGAVVYAARLQDTATKAADPLGTEIDIVGSYAITPNVSWTIGGGYLIAGDYFGNNDNPWGAMSAFTVKF